MLNHPITLESFAIIDRQIGSHTWTAPEYAIVRRAIHATADFELNQLFRFQAGAIDSGIHALQSGCPIVVDVTMVRQGILTMLGKTFRNPVITAVEAVAESLPGKTHTETGIMQCFTQYPNAIYVIGNAPTALMALCAQASKQAVPPALVIGVPVGFVQVEVSKQTLMATEFPYICVAGCKGGSPVAAAIVNALLVLAWERAQQN
ncbi:MAG: cobalt-precorrin-8X methylmutase [Spirulina sp. SIO3F2]|nr:cobalt-precorrin-8X methylmutase [Spirulina sp. SIO3F2]